MPVAGVDGAACNLNLETKDKVRRWIGHQRTTLIVSSTTGHGVKHYLPMIHGPIKLIVVAAHKIGNPHWEPFDPQVRKEVERCGGVILNEKMAWAVKRVLSILISRFPFFMHKEKNWEELLAVGGRVCLQITEMAVKKDLVKRGEIVVAVSGKNTALALKIAGTKPPKIALQEVILRSEEDF